MLLFSIQSVRLAQLSLGAIKGEERDGRSGNVGLEFIGPVCHHSIMRGAMITLLGMHLSVVAHAPLPPSTSEDLRVPNGPVASLLNQIWCSGIGMPTSPRGSWAGIWNTHLIYCHFTTCSSPVMDFNIFERCADSQGSDRDFNTEVPVPWNSHSWRRQTRTCFASSHKIHWCQLHLQLYLTS